jgi:DNA polymerase-3 subunit gamma/tau
MFVQPDAGRILRWAADLEQWAPDHAQLLEEFAALLVRVALTQAVPGYEGDEIIDAALLRPLAEGLAPEDVQLYYQCAILGRRDLHLAPDPRTGFEMTLLRMLAFRLDGTPGSVSAGAPARPGVREGDALTAARAAVSVSTSAMTSTPAAATTAAVRAPVPATAPTAAVSMTAPMSVSASVSATTAAPIDIGDWSALVSQLGLTGVAAQLARNCAVLKVQGGVVQLSLDSRFGARTAAAESRLAQALSTHFGQTLTLQFNTTPGAETPAQAEERAGQVQLEAARRAVSDDPTVRALQERFGAMLLPETIRPSN